ncbi:MAG: hypothetical protein VW835_20895 [Rickettsiales bacterium]
MTMRWQNSAARSLLATMALAAAVALASDAGALDAKLTQAEQQQFLDWCTGEKKATDSVCSCTLKSVATTVPAAALTSYISGQATGSSFSMSNLATQTGVSAAVAVTQALATCSQ